MDKYEELAKLILNSKKICFFGGAGVSTESGIPDFRGENGLYLLKSKYGVSYEEILSLHFFNRDPLTFFKFYKEFMINTQAKPNYAHLFLANLSRFKDVAIITQNIDGLHFEAGSKNVIELHGSIKRNYCTNCAKFYSLDEFLASFKAGLPLCNKCNHLIKPDVTLYEEPLNENIITKAIINIMDSDLLIIAGTSLKVYPANSFINYFYGDNIVVINKEKLDINRNIKLEINDLVGKTFKKVNSFLNHLSTKKEVIR